MASNDTWIFRQGMLWSIDLNQSRNANSVSPGVPAEFERVQDDCISDLQQAIQQMDPIEPTALKKRLKLNCQCFVSRVNGEIASYGWLTHGTEWVGEFERKLRIPSGEAYIWDCATLPQYRRQGLFTALLSHVVEQLMQEKLRRLWIIGVVSPAGIDRGFHLAGFRPVVRLTYLRLFNTRALLLTPQAEVSPAEVDAARRLLTAENDRVYGRVMLSVSTNLDPPATHFDR